jgi:hypothetical protein
MYPDPTKCDAGVIDAASLRQGELQSRAAILHDSPSEGVSFASYMARPQAFSVTDKMRAEDINHKYMSMSILYREALSYSPHLVTTQA